MVSQKDFESVVDFLVRQNRIEKRPTYSDYLSSEKMNGIHRQLLELYVNQNKNQTKKKSKREVSK